MKNIEFWKYHGCGNDFLIIEEDQTINYEKTAKKLCERHFGMGADGLIVAIKQPLGMRIFNQDGSEATMCGNGIRCLIYFFLKQYQLDYDAYEVETKAGMFHGKVIKKEPFEVEIDMGTPDFTLEQSGVVSDAPIIDYPFYMHFHIYMITTMIMGTIHTVLFVNDIKDPKWEKVGGRMHHHPFFQKETNVNFVEIVDTHTLAVRTYEKGVGMTLACGSGACAAAYCAYIRDFCKAEIRVLLKKGTLQMKIVDNHVLMRGAAQYIGKGMYQVEEDFYE